MKIIIILAMILLVIGCVPIEETTSTVKVESSSCNTQGVTNVYVKYYDTLSNTNNYIASEVYFMPLTAGYEREDAGVLTSDGDYSESVELDCETTGVVWEPVALTKKDVAHSVKGESFTSEGNSKKIILKGKSMGALQLRVYDNQNKKYLSMTNCDSITGNWYGFNGNKCLISDSGFKSFLASDRFVDFDVIIKTKERNTQYGEDDLNNWVVINAKQNDYETIDVQINGKVVDNQFASMNLDDRRKYSGYSFAYNIKPVDGSETKINVYMVPYDGINPSTPIIFDLCAEGRYDSNKELDGIKSGCWTDSSSQSLVSNTNRQYFEIEVI